MSNHHCHHLQVEVLWETTVRVGACTACLSAAMLCWISSSFHMKPCRAFCTLVSVPEVNALIWSSISREEAHLKSACKKCFIHGTGLKLHVSVSLQSSRRSKAVCKICGVLNVLRDDFDDGEDFEELDMVFLRSCNARWQSRKARWRSSYRWLTGASWASRGCWAVCGGVASLRCCDLCWGLDSSVGYSK